MDCPCFFSTWYILKTLLRCNSVCRIAYIYIRALKSRLPTLCSVGSFFSMAHISRIIVSQAIRCLRKWKSTSSSAPDRDTLKIAFNAFRGVPQALCKEPEAEKPEGTGTPPCRHCPGTFSSGSLRKKQGLSAFLKIHISFCPGAFVTFFACGTWVPRLLLGLLSVTFF